MFYLFALFSLFFSVVTGETYYEGTATFRNYGKVDLNWLVQFLPFNPIIVEAGAYRGDQVLYAAKVWPQYQRIIAFEPNDRARGHLEMKVAEAQLERVNISSAALSSYTGSATLYVSYGPHGNDYSYERDSSLLPPLDAAKSYFQGVENQVPCVVLDDWCQNNHVDHIDILRLELEGIEIQVLQSSPNILKNTKIIIVSTFFNLDRKDMSYYFSLKGFLTEAKFVPLAHWYDPHGRGLAVYISQELFDAYFVRCLGLGLGGLNYP